MSLTSSICDMMTLMMYWPLVKSRSNYSYREHIWSLQIGSEAIFTRIANSSWRLALMKVYAPPTLCFSSLFALFQIFIWPWPQPLYIWRKSTHKPEIITLEIATALVSPAISSWLTLTKTHWSPKISSTWWKFESFFWRPLHDFFCVWIMGTNGYLYVKLVQTYFK